MARAHGLQSVWVPKSLVPSPGWQAAHTGPAPALLSSACLTPCWSVPTMFPPVRVPSSHRLVLTCSVSFPYGLCRRQSVRASSEGGAPSRASGCQCPWNWELPGQGASLLSRGLNGPCSGGHTAQPAALGQEPTSWLIPNKH